MVTKRPESARKRSIGDGMKAAGLVNNDEQSRDSKAELRRRVAAHLGGIDKCRVFDAFAGSGEMHNFVWQGAETYVGCDREFYRDERNMFVTDTRRLMRCMDLRPFNVFDFDAYGAPWDVGIILAARRIGTPGERIGLCLTDGSGYGARVNATSNAFTELTGYKFQSGMARDFRRFHIMACQKLAIRLKASIEKHWLYARNGDQVCYSSMVVKVWTKEEAENALHRLPGDADDPGAHNETSPAAGGAGTGAGSGSGTASSGASP